MSIEPITTTSRQVRYVRNGDVHLAFEVLGDGPIDLIVVPGFANHLDASWDEPSLVEFQQRLAGTARLILDDRRGQGLSDRTETAPSIGDNVGDIAAVLDAAGSEHTVLLGDIAAPALVIHRNGDRLNPVDHGRYVADWLSHATDVELSGDDHLWCIPDPADVVGGFLEHVSGAPR